MNEAQKKLVARKYLDKQLETMKRYGSMPEDISEEEYLSLVEEVIDASGALGDLSAAAVSKAPFRSSHRTRW